MLHLAIPSHKTYMPLYTPPSWRSPQRMVIHKSKLQGISTLGNGEGVHNRDGMGGGRG